MKTAYNNRHMRIEEITPEIAERLLKTNRMNRHVSDAVVNRIVEDLKNDRWFDNGQPISFFNDGRLADGQHRLLAIVKSKKSATVKLEFGLNPDCAPTIDSGMARNLANVLEISGYRANSILIMSTVNALLTRTIGNRKTRTYSNQEKLDWFFEHADLIDSIPFATKCARLVPRSISCALHYLMRKKDSVLADSFFNALADGANLAPNEPVFHLRNRLILERNDKQARNPIRRHDVEDMMIIAWNATRSGKKLTRLRLESTTETLKIE